MTQFAAALDLATLDGTNGYRLYSDVDYDYAGYAVSGIGDVNGDGFADIIVGAPYNGHAYVVFGGTASLAALDAADGVTDGASLFSNLDGTTGFIIESNAPFLGASVSGGDISGDGVSDVMFSGFGFAILLDGNDTDPFPAVIDDGDIGAIDGTNGYLFLSNGYGFFGTSLSSAGDVNGDGFEDLIVGAPYEQLHTGSAYVIFGGAHKLGKLDAADGTVDGEIDPALAKGATGFRIDGDHGEDCTGKSVGGGDFNGDGFSDLIVGAQCGVAYVVFGSDASFGRRFSAKDIDGTNGVRLVGVVDSGAGYSVSTAGDINADGIADLIVGAPSDDTGATYAGASYVVFGGQLSALDAADGTADGTALLPLVDGNTGFVVMPGTNPYSSGWSVSSAGDINGDGFADILVGAPYGSPNSNTYAGIAYVVFGKAGGFSASLDLTALDGDDGFAINGEAEYDGAGWSVRAAGDVNGDGFDDLTVGAFYSYEAATIGGAAYIVYGHKPDEAVTRNGTDIGNIIHGSDFNDAIRGFGGGDTLIGHDGRDSIYGGAANDVITGGAGIDFLTGGAGTDAFVYEQVSDSVRGAVDKIRGFDATSDTINMWFTVDGVDAAVTPHGLGGLENTLSSLGAHHAALATLDNGRTYIAIDVDGVNGYEDGVDVLIRINNGQNLNLLSTSSFDT